jgi:prepilin signal peptidase PulO-like enzyme (type II secretory pathway)
MNWPLWTIGLGTLWIGAGMDWRSRKVPNRLWLVALTCSVLFLVVEAVQSPGAFALRLAGAAISAVVAWGLWRSGQTGGADAKAIMVAGLLLGPVPYFDPDAGKFLPILDALAAGLLVAEAWRRLSRQHSTPFLVPLAALATLAPITGGLLWLPFVWLGELVRHLV